MIHAPTMTQVCSIAPIVLTGYCRVTGECGRLSGAAISATLVARTCALRYHSADLQNDPCVTDAPAQAGGYKALRDEYGMWAYLRRDDADGQRLAAHAPSHSEQLRRTLAIRTCIHPNSAFGSRPLLVR